MPPSLAAIQPLNLPGDPKGLGKAACHEDIFGIGWSGLSCMESLSRRRRKANMATAIAARPLLAAVAPITQRWLAFSRRWSGDILGAPRRGSHVVGLSFCG